MVATFPDFLGAPYVSGYTQSPDFGVIRFDTDSGPAKQRPRNSRPIKTRSLQYDLGGPANVLVFEAWIANDIAGGAGWFMWPDPVDGVTKLGRAVGGKFDISPSSPALWQVKFQLETYG